MPLTATAELTGAQIRLYNVHDGYNYAEILLTTDSQDAALQFFCDSPRTKMAMITDFGNGGWKSRKSGLLMRHENGDITYESYNELIQKLLMQPNPFIRTQP